MTSAIKLATTYYSITFFKSVTHWPQCTPDFLELLLPTMSIHMCVCVCIPQGY